MFNGNLKRTGAEWSLTFKELTDEYICNYAIHNKRTWREDKRILTKYWFPSIGTKSIAKVSKADILAHLRAERARGVGASVNRQLATIRGMYNWAVKQGYCSQTPCRDVDPPAKENRCERFFKMPEYTAIFHAMREDTITNENVKTAFTMLAYTGARRSEVVKAKWAQVDLVEGTWDIPKEDSKNGKGRSIPLAPELVVLLKAHREKNPKSAYLFKGRRKKDCHMHPNGINHLVLRLKKACPDLADWHCHVLRKSAGTHLRRLKTDWETLKMILGHTRSADVTTRYDFYDGAEEKRDAMEKWGRELTRYIAP